MAENYKATKAFSFGNISYVEGQEVNVADKNAIEKLKSKKLISAGKGKTAAEVQEERDEAFDKEAKASAKEKAEQSQAEYDRVFGEKKKNAGPNAAPPAEEQKVSTIKVKDETKK